MKSMAQWYEPNLQKLCIAFYDCSYWVDKLHSKQKIEKKNKSTYLVQQLENSMIIDAIKS